MKILGFLATLLYFWLHFQFGCDYSFGLLTICRGRGFEVARSDCLALPFKSDAADGVICIAVIHHLSTKVEVLSELL